MKYSIIVSRMKSLINTVSFYFSFVKTKIKKRSGRNSGSRVSVFIHPFHDISNFVDQFTDISGCFREGHKCYSHKCVQSIDGFTWILE